MEQGCCICGATGILVRVLSPSNGLYKTSCLLHTGQAFHSLSGPFPGPTEGLYGLLACVEEADDDQRDITHSQFLPVMRRHERRVSTRPDDHPLLVLRDLAGSC
jgi:hypothetical protein